MDCQSFAMGSQVTLLKVSCLVPEACVKEKISVGIVILGPLECLQVMLQGDSQGLIHPTVYFCVKYEFSIKPLCIICSFLLMMLGNSYG